MTKREIKAGVAVLVLLMTLVLAVIIILLHRILKDSKKNANFELSNKILICNVFNIIKIKKDIGICKELKGINKLLELTFVNSSNAQIKADDKIKYHSKVRSCDMSSKVCQKINTTNIFAVKRSEDMLNQKLTTESQTSRLGFIKTPMNRVSAKAFNHNTMLKLSEVASMCSFVLMLSCLMYLILKENELSIIGHIILILSVLHILGASYFSFACRNIAGVIDDYCKYDSVNWLLYKAGVVRKVKTRKLILEPGSPQQIITAIPHENWECIFWLTSKEDDKRKDWCNDERIGLMYTEATLLYDESIGHLEAASAGLSIVSGIYQFSPIIIVASITVYFNGLNVLGGIVSGLVVATGAVIAANSSILFNVGCARAKVVIAHSLMATINGDKPEAIVANAKIEPDSASELKEYELLFCSNLECPLEKDTIARSVYWR